MSQTGMMTTCSIYTTNQTAVTTSGTLYKNRTICVHTNGNTIWEEDVTPTQYYDLARQRVYVCRERSEAETRRLAEEQRQREARARIAQEQRRLAGERAKALLVSHLTKEQRKTFEELGWFIVKGGLSGNHYKINTKGYAGNIHMLKQEKAIAQLCCHADGIPLHDHHLAQMIALKYDEERFLRIANHTRIAA